MSARDEDGTGTSAAGTPGSGTSGDGTSGDGMPGAGATERSEFAPIHLVLGEGATAELTQCRERVARDPLAALAFAETRQLIEHLRGVRVTPSWRFGLALDSLVRRAERRRQLLSRPAPVPGVALRFLVAAALVFAVLALLDPLHLRDRARPSAGEIPPVAVQPAVRMQPVTPTPVAGLRLAETLAAIRAAAERLAAGSKLLAALDRFQGLAPAERLASWLQANQRVAEARLGFQRRASGPARRQALQANKSLPEVDDRVQALARDLATEVRTNDALPVPELALVLRALLASGACRADDPALQDGVERLRAALPLLEGGELASALAALGEVAASTGTPIDELQEHGERLLRSVLGVDGDNWTRARPSLLAPKTPVDQLADAGRFLALGPCFGLDAEAVLLVRLLIAAHLQERRDLRRETPNLLVALAYGFGDLLSRAERDEVEARLLAWQPASLVPDYLALQQLAWSRVPAQRGFAHFQLEMQFVSALATPATTRDKAAFCLSLATNFAAPGALDGAQPGD